MEFWTAVAILRRRWYIVVPGVLLTVLAAVGLVGQMKPVYQATGSMVLLQTRTDSGNPSATGTPAAPEVTTTLDPAKLNAMNQLGGVQFANLVAQAASGSTFRDNLVASGGSPTFEVKPPFGDLPVVTLTSSETSPTGAMEGYRHLVEAVQREIVDQQEKVGRLGALPWEGFESITPTEATPQGGARTKAMIMVVAVGALLTLGEAFIVDSMANARKRRRPQGMVTLISNSWTPLDDVAELDFDDPEARGRPATR